MSIPIASLGSQVYVQLPGVSGQVHEPCQDMHICGTCKLSFANVESFLTHKKTVCGKEVSEAQYEISVPTTSASAPSQSSSSVSIQTILQHPAPAFITAPTNAGGMHHISEEIPLRGQILRVLLGNNEFLFEKTEEMNSIGDLIPEETLQILPDLQTRKGMPEKVNLNGDSHEKTKPVAEKSEIPEMQAVCLENEDRSSKTQHQSIVCERKEQIFQHDEENVVSLLASQLGNTSNPLEKQGCSYPESVVNEQSLCGVSSSPSGGLPVIHAVNDSNSSLKCKPGILTRKVRGKNSEDTVFSINICTEKNGAEKSKSNSKRIRQELTTKLFPEGEDVTSRKRMSGLFKQRKIHMCAVEACEFSTTFTKDLIRHMRKHTGERPFKCDKCSRWFSRVDKLRTHLRIHAGLKPHACKLCEYKAVDSGSLRKHMRVHTKERPYRCQICEYSARDSSQLTVHLRTHTGDHPFVCSHASCSAAFKTSSDLKRHERTHTGEKPFHCELCPYKCAISSNLKAHVRQNHSKNKTWMCSTCSYAASSKNALKEHEKTHTVPAAEGDAFECKICGVTFSDSESFSSHLKTNPHCASSDSTTKTKDTPATAQKKPFQCSDCDFSCMQRGNLKNHIQRKHCIAEDTGKRKTHGNSSKGATKGKGGRQSNGAGQPFCLRSHHCPLCNASFVREDSWRSHVRQHQSKGEGLDIPLGPMMPSLVDSSEVNLIGKAQGNSRSDTTLDTPLSSKENGNKAMKNRPYIAISFEENRKVQEEHQNNQGESNIMDDFQGSEEENQSVLLYVQADQEGPQSQDDDESLRNGAEILASLNQGIPSQTTVVNSPKAVSSIATSANSCQQHAILLTAPQQTNQAPKGHGSTNANSSTCQYIALPHEQTAIIDQLTAALQPGLQYMISGPLEAIMALPSALEQKQMVASNQKSSYDGPIISLQLSNDKDNVGM